MKAPGSFLAGEHREKNAVYYRLIALWVICEAMLGGIIHGFKIPVSGLVVGSCAITCICLIGWYVPKKGNILKATIIVAIFKMMLSPQAPPPAYIAVFFQGLVGELLFLQRRSYTLACVVLAVLGLLESGLQRIVVLTIVGGNDFWHALNSFINGLTKQKNATNYSLWIAGIYTALHFIAGILVGWWASHLPGRIEKWSREGNYSIHINESSSVPEMTGRKRTNRKKSWLLIMWLLLIALYAQSYFKIGAPLLPSHISLKIFLRSLIIVLGWIFIISPLLIRLLHGWLKKRQTRSQRDVQEVLQLLPATRELISQSWKYSAGEKGWRRINLFTKVLLVNNLGVLRNTRCEVYIFSSPVQSGKTTSLLNWVKQEENVFGIVTPVVEGKRVFMNLHSGEQFAMEASGNEESLHVGRFAFSKAGFEKAIAIIRAGIEKDGWLVIDEIGPLELRGEGFSAVLEEVLKLRTGKLLLVVRSGLQEEVKARFNIHPSRVFNSMGSMTQVPC